MRKREISTGMDGCISGTEDRNSQFVTALSRGLDVLRAFRRGDPPLGNQELARRTGLPKPTISRITYTLSKLGYITYCPEISKYTPSVGALALGFTALGSFGIRDVARPMMQDLADRTGISVGLATRDRLSMVYIEHCLGDGPVLIGLDTGSHVKLGVTAIGRAYMAGLDPAERGGIMDLLAQREGDRWPAIRQGLDQAVRDLKSFGFTISEGDWKPQVNAVGVPLQLGSGALSFALHCGGPAFATPRDKLISDIGPRLADMACRIERAMGVI
jgi:DNA-binding IclR family transcriptional regulator